MHFEKVCIIMRGAPGSGKSTRAKQIADDFRRKGSVVFTFSTDNFFTRLDSDGNRQYQFDPKRLSEAHKFTQDSFAYRAVDSTANLLIVDNTNIQPWQYAPYVEAAQANGYTVYQCVCKGEYDNVHSVPEHAVIRMRSQFEEDDSIPHWEE